MVADCLLVVDDQKANIQILELMLGRLGFEILPAATGAEALKWLAVRRPDLILLDLLMPGMDGFEVCKRIQQNPDWADISIVFLSASEDKNLIARALEMGGVDCLTKPFGLPGTALASADSVDAEDNAGSSETARRRQGGTAGNDFAPPP